MPGRFAIGTLTTVSRAHRANPLYSGGLAMLGWLVGSGLGNPRAHGRRSSILGPVCDHPDRQRGDFLLLLPALLVVPTCCSPSQALGPSSSPGAAQFRAGVDRLLVATSLIEGERDRSVGPPRSYGHGVGRRGPAVFGLLGTATLAFPGGSPTTLSRVSLRRDWAGTLLAEATLLGRPSPGGRPCRTLALITGGVAHGSLIAQGGSPEEIEAFVFWFRLGLGAGIGLSALAAAVVALNVFLMYTSGRRADYAVLGDALPAAAGH